MWKHLLQADTVTPGDRLRFTKMYDKTISDDHLYKVIKVDQHYFVLVPSETSPIVQTEQVPGQKIVKLTDIGYHIDLDRWVDDASQSISL